MLKNATQPAGSGCRGDGQPVSLVSRCRVRGELRKGERWRRFGRCRRDPADEAAQAVDTKSTNVRSVLGSNIENLLSITTPVGRHAAAACKPTEPIPRAGRHRVAVLLLM